MPMARAKPHASPSDSPANDQILSWYAVAEDVNNLLQLAAQNWENTAESEYFIK